MSGFLFWPRAGFGFQNEAHLQLCPMVKTFWLRFLFKSHMRSRDLFLATCFRFLAVFKCNNRANRELTSCSHLGAFYLTCFARVCRIFISEVSESQCGSNQGRNEVIWRPGKKTNSAPPWSYRLPHGRSLATLRSNLSYFEGKFTVLKKVLVTLLGLFGASRNNSAPLQWSSDPVVNLRPGNCAPFAPSLRPWFKRCALTFYATTRMCKVFVFLSTDKKTICNL